MNELAAEISQALGTEDQADITAIENWLLDGNDDGSSVDELGNRFQMEVGLASQA
jgi:hypothetical protein